MHEVTERVGVWGTCNHMCAYRGVLTHVIGYLWCCVCVVWVFAHACVCMYVRAPAETAARDAPASTCQLGEQLEAQWEGGGITVCEKKRRTVSNISLLPSCVISSLSACSSLMVLVLLLFFVIQGSWGYLWHISDAVNYCSFLTQEAFFFIIIDVLIK